MKSYAAVIVFLMLSSVPAKADWLVWRAKTYLGQSARQIGLHRDTLWCATFVAKVTGRNLGDQARAWLKQPHTDRRIGAVAVLTRGKSKNSGHVGIVSGFRGRNVVLISGNHNGVVGEGVYPPRRVLAFVNP